jgi:hypothetical protein
MALVDALKEIQAIVGDVSGVRAAPEFAPDNPPQGLFSVALPASGLFRQQPAGVLCGLHDVQLWVVCPRVDLAKTLKNILPLGELVAAELENHETLHSTCSTFSDITYTFNTSINLGTAADPSYYSGWIFTISQIKIEDESILT